MSTQEQGRRSSRDALIGAALAEFSEKGYEAATVTDIAERAGVTTGALYGHFRGKLDLLLQALGIMPASDLFRELSEAATQPWSQVSQLFGDSMAAIPDEATLLLLDAIVAARRDTKVAKILRDGFAAYEDAMTRATHAGAALGLLAPALPIDDLSRMMTLLALGRLVVAAIDAPAPSHTAYEQLAELFLQGGGGVTPPVDPEGDDTSVALGEVRARARAVERARRALVATVVAGAGRGHSLRELGAAAGVSHERIRQMLRDPDA